MGNMGRYGGGINALRGIHNVQGSTDMGLLYGNIPAYSGNPTLAQQPSTDANGFGKYMDALWGNPLSGSGSRPHMDGIVRRRVRRLARRMALQQRGFYNMTQKFFGTPDTLAGTAADKAKIDALFSLWPKGNGDDHRIMFRKMITGATKVLVSWGQNPAVTEPNQGAIRAGLENLDLLVVTDMFETETAACDRKATRRHLPDSGRRARRGRRQCDQLRSYAAVALPGSQACRQQQGRPRAPVPSRLRARRRRRVQPHLGRLGRGWRHLHVGLRRAVRHRSTRTAGTR